MRREVLPNDVVWIVRMGPGSATAQLYVVPAADTRRSRRSPVHGGEDPRTAILEAISALEQKGSRTDLRDAIEISLVLLQSRPGASQRTLVIGSDFIQDVAPGRATVVPPRFAAGTSAAGVRVVLVHARPAPGYLASVKLSAGELLFAVHEHWVRWFRQIGGTPTVHLVDALAAGS